MAISFRCQNCNQRLSAAERKIGQQVSCPKCKASITIPGNKSAAKRAVKSAASDVKPATNDVDPAANDTETSGEIDAFSELMVYDQAPVEIAESFDAVDLKTQTNAAAPSSQATDPTLVAVSRRVLYVQAVMIASATIGAFVLGYLIGAGGGTTDGPSPEDSSPVSINGRLTYENNAGETVGDSGSIVIALPMGLSLLPEEKLVVDGLGPLSEQPLEDDPVWASIDAMGGTYGRTDDDGAFRIILSPGMYYVLFVSRHTQRSKAADLDRRHVAEMGNYFQGTFDLIGDQKFHWSKQEFRDAAYLNHQF